MENLIWKNMFFVLLSVASAQSSSRESNTTALSTQNEAASFQNREVQNDETSESWLKQHNRFVFIIFIGLFVLGLLIWYIVRSVKSMRRKLAQENAQIRQSLDPDSYQQLHQVNTNDPTRQATIDMSQDATKIEYKA